MSDRAVIAVTGAASGIGAGIAQLLTERGVTVVGLDCADPPAAREPRIRLDLRSPTSIRAAASRLPERVDALCNVAGMHPFSAEGGEIVTVNYLGTRLLTECVVSRMGPGGAVLNMASTAGAAWLERLALHRELIACETFEAGVSWLRAHPVARADGYAYSKEALIAWTVHAAAAWVPRGIRVNALAPGPVETPAFRVFQAAHGNIGNPDVELVGRAGRIDEVARVAAFMCSQDAGWVNGAVLSVDGGLRARHLVNGGD